MKICKKCGAQLADDARFCNLCGEKQEEEEILEEQPVEEEVILTEVREEPDPQPQEEPEQTSGSSAGLGQSQQPQWYYVQGSETIGPRSQEQMIDLIRQHVLDGSSYVWKTGMADWALLAGTELAAYLERKPESRAQAPYTGGSSHTFVTEKSLPLYIILSIVTCGIFALYWIYAMAKDTSEILQEQHQEPLTSPGTVLLLSIVTCGLYFTYYIYKAARALGGLEINGWKVPDNAVVCCLLSVLTSVVSFAIYQDTLNQIVRHS